MKDFTPQKSKITGQIVCYGSPVKQGQRKKTVSGRIVLIIACVLIIAAIVCFAVLKAEAEDAMARWILCKPKTQVSVRRLPSKVSRLVGQLEVGDRFMTDGTIRFGFIRAVGFGEYGEGWIYAGYVVEDPPVAVNERYVCVARKQVACRRWCRGPRIKGRIGWLKNGTSIKVYYRSSQWSVTSRGYIRSEWLEADPE